MKNKLIIDNKNKDIYKVLMKIELNSEEYIIYTKDELNKIGDKICYVAKYTLDDGIQKLFPLDSIDTLENIDEVFRKILLFLDKKGK